MKIFLLESGRGTNDQAIAKWCEHLGITPNDEILLVSHSKPRDDLPISRHFLVRRRGKSLHKLQELPTSGDKARALISQPAPATDTDELLEAASPLSETELGEQLPEAAAPRRAPLGSYSASQIAHALRWRVNRVRFAARRVRRGIIRRIKKRQPRVVRHLTSFRFAASYGLALRRSTIIREAFGQSEVAMPLDARSHLAAWLLARKVSGPQVVVGFGTGSRAIAAAREASATGLEENPAAPALKPDHRALG